MPRLLIVILAALSMLGALSIDAYLPALPTIARQFSVTAEAAQQSLTIYAVGFAVMNLFYGTLSDSFGRRPVILISLVLYLLSTIGAACSSSLELLIVFRFLQGLTAGAGAVVGRAIVGDLWSGPDAHRAMSYIMAVFGIAPALAPILGGWLLAWFGWPAIFIFIAIFTLLLFVACLLALKESLPVAERAPFHFSAIVRSYWEVCRHPRFMWYSLSGTFVFSGFMIYIMCSPIFVLDQLHLKVTDFGWLFVPLIGAATVGSIVAGWLSRRWRAETIIRRSFALMVFALAVNLAYCAWGNVRIPWAVLPISLYALGASVAAPGMTMMAIEMFPKARGLAASFQTFLFMIFLAGSAALPTSLLQSPLSFAVISAAGVVASMMCWWLGSERKGRRIQAANRRTRV